MQGLDKKRTYSRRSRFFLAFYFLLVLAYFEIGRWSGRPEVTWEAIGIEGIVASYLLTVAFSSFIQTSDTGITSYLGWGKLESSWKNVEGVRTIAVGGRDVRCLVFKARGIKSGWYWAEDLFAPKEYRGRMILIPERGPWSYHDDARLLAEVSEHIMSGGGTEG